MELDQIKISKKIRKLLIFAGSFFLSLALIYIDYLSGLNVHLTALLLIPIYFAAWYTGLLRGLIVSLLCAFSLLMDPILEHKMYLHLWEVFWNIAVLFIFFVLFTYLLTRLKQELIRTRQTARVDNLTGLLNSRAFFEQAEQERLRSIRNGHPFTLCFMDLDNFKAVNDSLGHITGDELLKIVAKALTENVRHTDLVVRLGGDEFAVLFPETGLEAVSTIVEKLHEAINREIRQRGWSVTPSFGVATFEEVPGTVNDMIHHADQLMYQAKGEGKNRIKSGTIGPQRFDGKKAD